MDLAHRFSTIFCQSSVTRTRKRHPKGVAAVLRVVIVTTDVARYEFSARKIS